MAQLDDDKLDAIWEWADADCDGFLSRDESARLLMATEGKALEDGQYAKMCEGLGVQDPAIGITFAQYKRVYEMEMGDLDADYTAIFPSQPEPAPAPPPPAQLVDGPKSNSEQGGGDGEEGGAAAPNVVDENTRDQLKAIWAWADFDGDGYLNRQEINRLSVATDGKVPDDADYSDMCQQFGDGVVDEAVGLTFAQCSMIYELDIASVDKDHAALFTPEDRSTFLKAIWSWADSDGDGFLNQNESDRLQVKTLGIQTEAASLSSSEVWLAVCLQLQADPEVGLNYEQYVAASDQPCEDFEFIFGTITPE